MLVFLVVLGIPALGGTVELSGTYVLVEHPTGIKIPDRVAFQGGGACVVELEGKAGLAGKYQADAAGNLTIDAGNGEEPEKFQYARKQVSMILTDKDAGDFYYARLPAEKPHVEFKDLTGIFWCQNEMGESVTEITPVHRFRVLLRELSAPQNILTPLLTQAKDRTYTDVTLEGTCSYADGVTTYTVEHTDAAQPDQSTADVVIKRDAKGLWIVDAYHDAVICQPLVDKLELSAPPAGYQKAN
jgi:hypothetical protein